MTSGAVLVAADLLLDDARGLRGLAVLRLALVLLLPLLDEPEATLVEHASSRYAHDAGLVDLGVDRLARLFLGFRRRHLLVFQR